jgi:hypothetical protein
MKNLKYFKKFENQSDENTREGYLKVEILDDTINNGRNTLVKIKCIDKSNTECELLVSSSDLKDKVSDITNKF